MLNEKQIRAIELIANKHITGMNYNDIASELAVDRTTLARWRNIDTFRASVISKAKAMNEDYTPIALDRLQKLLSSANENVQLKAIELFLKSSRYINEDKDINVTVGSKENVNDILKRLNL